MSTVALSLDEAVHALDVAVITLTSFNAIAAAAVLVLICLDNGPCARKCKTLSKELRLPFYLAIAILVSQVLFIIREAMEFGAVNNESQSCTALSETSWWAIWFPIIALTVRTCTIVGSVLFHYDVYSMASEVLYCCITVFASVLFWIPSHIFATSPCTPFVMTFSPSTNSTLGLVSVILLSFFLVLACISFSAIAWDVWRPSPPNRRTPYLEFDLSNIEEYQITHRKEISMKRGALSYGLGASCIYAALLPNFTMVAISRTSPSAVYVASVAIHLTGIILLLQYLFLRASFNSSEPPSSTSLREIEDLHLLRPQRTNRQSRASNHSTQSDEYTRKRRRPHSTYGGGGDYLRRESSNFSWDSLPGTLVDRTASGRKIPPRSPNVKFDWATTERPRTAEQLKTGERAHVGGNSLPLRRSKSYSGDIHPSMVDGESLVPLKYDSRENEVEIPRPTTSSSRKLRRRVDQIPSKPDLSELFHESNVTPEPPRDSLEALSKRESSGQAPGPVLLPPLLDPMISRSALLKQEAASRPSSSRGTSESASSGSRPRPFFNTGPSQTDDGSPPTPSSEFVFPFQPSSDIHSHEEDDPDQSTSQDDTPVSGSLANLIEHPYSWSLNLDDLIQPDPPFASEDHFYLCSPTSESRLSTITEEGTIRSVATPPNIVVSDTPTPRASPSIMMPTITPLSANTMSWFAQSGPQYDVDKAMNRLGKSPSPDVGGQKE